MVAMDSESSRASVTTVQHVCKYWFAKLVLLNRVIMFSCDFVCVRASFKFVDRETRPASIEVIFLVHPAVSTEEVCISQHDFPVFFSTN